MPRWQDDPVIEAKPIKAKWQDDPEATTVPKHPHAIVGEKVIGWLPEIGGAVGGAVGLAGGTVLGFGVGGAPGAIGGATLGGAAGESAKQLINRSIGKAAPATSADAAKAVGVQGGIQGGAQAVGGTIGAGMLKAAPVLMQSAVKPTLATLKQFKTTAPKVAKTLLEEGVNVTRGGLAKLEALLTATNKEIGALVANAPGTIPKERVAAQALSTAGRFARQTNPTADLQAVGATVQEFLEHPVYRGALSVPEAQALKVGTYQQVGKKYGQLSSAHTETQKALARGLKEEVADAVPAVAELNKKDSAYMAAVEAVGRRLNVAGNRDPVGFAWVTSQPATFLAALMDRHPAVKSMIANAMWKSASAATGVTPQLIRAAVHALTTEAPDDEPPAQ